MDPAQFSIAEVAAAAATLQSGMERLFVTLRLPLYDAEWRQRVGN